jgi:recombinational DNA repair ATPase RecF
VVASLGANFSFQLDGVVVPFNPLPVVVLVLRRSPPRGEEESDLGWVARWLGVTPEVVRRLVEGIASEGNPFVEAMTVSSDGKIEVDLKVHRGMLRLGHRGGSGDVMVALALAVARAQHTSLHAPTLLLIDEVLSAFDPFNKSVVLEELGRADRFQSLATLPEMDRQLRWSGWSVVHIESREGGALITAS